MGDTEALRLRLAGFAAAALGGLLIGLGSLAMWAEVGLGDDPEGVLSSRFRGIDVWEGRVVLATALVVILAVMGTRFLAAPGTRRALAMLVIVASLVGGAIAGVDAVRAEDRFAGRGLDELARDIASRTGEPEGDVRDDLEAQRQKLENTSVGAGLYLVLAGSLLGLVGGGLNLAWVTSRGREEQPGSE